MDALFVFLQTNPGYFAGLAILMALFIIWQMAKLFAPTFAKNSDNSLHANEVSQGLVDIMGKHLVGQQAILEALTQTQNRQIELLASINARHESNTGKLELVSASIEKMLTQDTAKFSTIDLTLATVMNINTLLSQFEKEIPGVKAILNLISERLFQVHKTVTKISDDTQPITITVIDSIKPEEKDNHETKRDIPPVSEPVG